jgi:excisionase family DNA binding protein
VKKEKPASPFPPAERVPVPGERLLTRRELAFYLRVGVRTVDNMRAAKEIEAVLIRGRLVRFCLDDVLGKLKGE